MAYRKSKSNCNHCKINQRRCDHVYTNRCVRFCNFCMNWGHTMAYCHKIKDCKLCGVYGHNPLRCWRYCTIREWMERAEELGRCGECLTLFRKHATKCANCHSHRVYWDPKAKLDSRHGDNFKKTQTEDNSNKVQKGQKELQESKTMIKELKNKILELEEKLKSSNTAVSELEEKLESSNTALSEVGWKWKSTMQGKKQEEQKVKELDLLYKSGEMELIKLQEEISQKDIELEKHRKRGVQLSQATPAAVQQQYSAQIQQHCPTSIQQHAPASTQQHCSAQIQQQCPVSTQLHCPASVSNNLGHYNIPNLIKPTLMDLQDQQQKICIMVNQLYDKVMTPNMSWLSYSSCNPNVGLYDTGQYFR